MGKAKVKAPDPSNPTPTTASPSWIKAAGGGVLIHLHVKPGSKVRSVTVSEDQLDIAIDAQAREGEVRMLGPDTLS